MPPSCVWVKTHRLFNIERTLWTLEQELSDSHDDQLSMPLFTIKRASASEVTPVGPARSLKILRAYIACVWTGRVPCNAW